MIFNGVMMDAEKPVITVDNRSFRYGDGCFETMKAVKRKIIHANEHFERFFTSLELLQFDKPNYLNAAYLKEHITKLLEQNKETAHVYLCGWKAMIDDARKNMTELGLDKKQVHFESFG